MPTPLVSPAETSLLGRDQPVDELGKTGLFVSADEDLVSPRDDAFETV
jgi:hypothetical protein